MVKNHLKLGLLVLNLCTISSVHAELLIIKHINESFAPLDASDDHNKAALADIFLNFEWPMVIANTKLTKKEMDDLLTPGKPFAEKEFIRAKVKQIDPNYDVIFVPTTLYELFAIGEIHDNEKIKFPSYSAQNPLESAALEYAKASRDKSVFYPTAFSFINTQLAEILLSSFLSAKAQSCAELENDIQNQANLIAAFLIHRMRDVGLRKFIKRHDISADNLNTVKAYGAIAQIITLEYQARAQNMGMLLRGANFSNVYKTSWAQLRELPPEKRGKASIKIAGSTIHERDLEEIAKAYKTKAMEPYSISYGNTLFGGFFNDQGACVYAFLTTHGREGYALFINKKEYMQNRIMDLFNIASFPPLISLFEHGEHFHSRAVAAVPVKEKEKNIIGLATSSSARYRTIRNPLVHAELFSNYLAQHMHVFSIGNESNFIPQEKKAFDEILIEETNKMRENQKELARYYKAIRTLEPFAKKVWEKVRKQLEQNKKKAAESKKQTSSNQQKESVVAASE